MQSPFLPLIGQYITYSDNPGGNHNVKWAEEENLINSSVY